MATIPRKKPQAGSSKTGRSGKHVTGSSSRSTGKPATTTPSISFLFRVDDPLSPNYSVQPAQGTAQDWLPPSVRNAFHPRETGRLYRWRDGLVTAVANPPANQTPASERFRCATVFLHQPYTLHFVAVEYDALMQNMPLNRPWSRLGFRRVSGGGNSQYNFVDFAGTHHHLVAAPRPNVPNADSWMRQLFTAQHFYTNDDAELPPPTSAGLIGKLPLIIALVALSCPKSHLHTVLTSSMSTPRQWIPHTHTQDARTERRGLIVTVWLDELEGHSTSTRQHLEALEAGSYGAFFR